MTVGEFADIVEKMRSAQKDFFKTHDSRVLKKAKEYEKLVDDVLLERKSRSQMRLFNDNEK